MDDKTILILAALVIICIIELVALGCGHNGAILSSVFLLIGGLVGYTGSSLYEKSKK